MRCKSIKRARPRFLSAPPESTIILRPSPSINHPLARVLPPPLCWLLNLRRHERTEYSPPSPPPLLYRRNASAVLIPRRSWYIRYLTHQFLCAILGIRGANQTLIVPLFVFSIRKFIIVKLADLPFDRRHQGGTVVYIGFSLNEKNILFWIC